MQIVETEQNIERVYEVTYDRKKLADLLDEIVRKVNYHTTGIFDISHGVEYDLKNQRIIGGEDAVLPNGDQRYIDIKKIYEYTSNSPVSYHNDSTGIEATMICVPELAYIIEAILLDDAKAIYDLLNYENNAELIPIEERIATLNSKINEMSNYDTDNKIALLQELKVLCSQKEIHQYFDAHELRSYYLTALRIIELELVSEKVIKKGNKILLKEYKNSKNIE